MKERLIERLDGADLFLRNRVNAKPLNPLNKYDIENFKDIAKVCDEAARTLEKAVIPPCKVGHKVYCVFEDDVIEDEIILIEVTKCAIYLSTCSERYMWINGHLYSEMLDQELYLTKEEAEAKLKESNSKWNQ